MLPANDSGELFIGRREFTTRAILALLSGCVITVAEACGSKNSVTQPSSTTPADIVGQIAANHTAPHAITVTGAQIQAGTALVGLNIQGQATHPHTISLSAADLASLKNRQAVTVTSTTDNGHSHAVTFTPA